ncbi:MAG TPA: TlpA disulfide reductase family protein [Pyrinomonadaceae bacterium]|nr:TlpA disulfide reductase family protein [Pyrinomonadaceae bacterium]
MKCKVFLSLLFFLLPVAAAAQNSSLPDLSLKDIKGRQLRLSDYRGKVVLINFWATWCPPCRAEVPYLVRLQRDYRSHGLRVIGITSPPQTFVEVRGFVRKAKINYPVALGTQQIKALFTPSELLPMTIVIGRDGSVQDIIEEILLPEEFEQKIKPLLHKPEVLYQASRGPLNRPIRRIR